MSTNALIRTAQAVLSMSAAFVVVDAVLPGGTVSGMSHFAGFLAGCGIGLMPLGLEHLRIKWAARQRHRAGYRQRHGMG